MVCGDYCFPVVKERERGTNIYLPLLSVSTDSYQRKERGGAHQLALVSSGMCGDTEELP